MIIFDETLTFSDLVQCNIGLGMPSLTLLSEIELFSEVFVPLKD